MYLNFGPVASPTGAMIKQNRVGVITPRIASSSVGLTFESAWDIFVAVCVLVPNFPFSNVGGSTGVCPAPIGSVILLVLIPVESAK